MKKKILVIDDYPAIRQSFQLVLEKLDCTVETAKTGEIGIEKFKKGDISLVFLDLKMPGMSGVEVLSKIRKESKDVPIYIVTAFHNEYLSELKEQEKKGFLFELLNKPVNRDSLLDVAKNFVDEPIKK